MLELTGITKTFFAGTVNERRALQDVNLRLAPAEFVTVIGSDAAGKSTLLNIVAGALTPDLGSVRIDDVELTRLPDHRRARTIRRVFQDPLAGTPPSMTMQEDLAPG